MSDMSQSTSDGAYGIYATWTVQSGGTGGPEDGTSASAVGVNRLLEQ